MFVLTSDSLLHLNLSSGWAMTILGHCFDNPRTVRIHYPIRSRPYTKEMNNKKQTREKEQKKKIRKTHTHTHPTMQTQPKELLQTKQTAFAWRLEKKQQRKKKIFISSLYFFFVSFSPIVWYLFIYSYLHLNKVFHCRKWVAFLFFKLRAKKIVYQGNDTHAHAILRLF